MSSAAPVKRYAAMAIATFNPRIRNPDNSVRGFNLEGALNGAASPRRGR
jgi:hypothetical protein